MKKIIFVVCVLLLLGVTVYFLLNYDNNRPNKTNIVDPTSNEKKSILEDDSKDFNTFYDNEKSRFTDEELEKSNSFDSIYNNFKKVSSLNDFKNFEKEFKFSWELFIYLIKLEDKKSYEKLFKLNYENNSDDIQENIKNSPLKNKSWYLDYISNFYDDIISWKQIVYSESDKQSRNDFKLIFSTSSLEDSLSGCNSTDWWYEIWVSDCSDKVYAYKSTPENPYCDKIWDKYESRICKDFLKHIKTIK